MRIGVVLTGLTNSVSGQKPRNWINTAESIRSKVIDCWSEKPRVYIATYPSNDLSSVIDYYKPNRSLILPYSGSHQRTTYIASLEQLVGEDIDFIISTRFDLDFAISIDQFPYKFDKFNFLFREVEPYWSQDQFVCDAFFAFPKVFLSSLIESIRREHGAPYRVYNDLHAIYRHLRVRIGESGCNFLFDGCHNSSMNSVYTIVRG